MKNFTFTTALLLMIVGSVAAQGVTFKSYVENTEVSPKIGFSIGYKIDEKIQVGAFYQEMATMLMSTEKAMPRFYEKEFVGAFLNYPIVANDRAAVLFNIRTGVTNGENFLITPSLLAQYQPLKGIAMEVGVGTRMFRPTLQAGLQISLNSRR